MIGGIRFYRVVVVLNGIEVSASSEALARQSVAAQASEIFRSWRWKITDVSEAPAARQERFDAEWRLIGSVRRRLWKFDLSIVAVVASFTADGARWEVVNLLGRNGLETPPHEPLLISFGQREYRVRLIVVPTTVGPRLAWLAEWRRQEEAHFTFISKPPRKVAHQAAEWFNNQMVRLGLRSRPDMDGEA